jgi:hypothetical protein
MPIILATWEAEIGKIAVLGQPGKKMFVRFQLNEKKLGVVACTCHPTYSRKRKIGGS